jgi:ferredoxin-NADP reductase
MHIETLLLSSWADRSLQGSDITFVPEMGRKMGTNAHTVEFLGSADPCSSTGILRFSRLPGYTYTPGQYLSLTLETREGEQTKNFSHCDSPQDPETEILTRMTGSAFKDALAALRPGDTVETDGPFGKLVLPEGAERAAFLVGGVGITPMRSIVRDSAQRSTGLTALVFDGNLDETCIPLRKEFDTLEKEHASIRFVHVLERPSPEWSGERGFISAETVRRHCDPLDGWHWFVSGPPAMVDAMARVIDALSVGASHVSFESFAGYR